MHIHTYSHTEASNMKLLFLFLAVLEMGSDMDSTDRGKVYVFLQTISLCLWKRSATITITLLISQGKG